MKMFRKNFSYQYKLILLIEPKIILNKISNNSYYMNNLYKLSFLHVTSNAIKRKKLLLI